MGGGPTPYQIGNEFPPPQLGRLTMPPADHFDAYHVRLKTPTPIPRPPTVEESQTALAYALIHSSLSLLARTHAQLVAPDCSPSKRRSLLSTSNRELSWLTSHDHWAFQLINIDLDIISETAQRISSGNAPPGLLHYLYTFNPGAPT